MDINELIIETEQAEDIAGCINSMTLAIYTAFEEGSACESSYGGALKLLEKETRELRNKLSEITDALIRVLSKENQQ